MLDGGKYREQNLVREKRPSALRSSRKWYSNICARSDLVYALCQTGHWNLTGVLPGDCNQVIVVFIVLDLLRIDESSGTRTSIGLVTIFWRIIRLPYPSVRTVRCVPSRILSKFPPNLELVTPRTSKAVPLHRIWVKLNRRDVIRHRSKALGASRLYVDSAGFGLNLREKRGKSRRFF